MGVGVTTELQNSGVIPRSESNGTVPSATYQLVVGLPNAVDPTLGRFAGLQAYGTAVCTLSTSEAPVKPSTPDFGLLVSCAHPPPPPPTSLQRMGWDAG